MGRQQDTRHRDRETVGEKDNKSEKQTDRDQRQRLTERQIHVDRQRQREIE